MLAEAMFCDECGCPTEGEKPIRGRDKLLQWCQSILSNYDIEVWDFESSWVLPLLIFFRDFLSVSLSLCLSFLPQRATRMELPFLEFWSTLGSSSEQLHTMRVERIFRRMFDSLFVWAWKGEYIHSVQRLICWMVRRDNSTWLCGCFSGLRCMHSLSKRSPSWSTSVSAVMLGMRSVLSTVFSSTWWSALLVMTLCYESSEAFFSDYFPRGKNDAELYHWLYSVKMEKFYQNFLDEEIDFLTLREPSVVLEEDLVRMKIPLGPRKKLWKAIQNLQRQTN